MLPRDALDVTQSITWTFQKEGRTVALKWEAYQIEGLDFDLISDGDDMHYGEFGDDRRAYMRANCIQPTRSLAVTEKRPLAELRADDPTGSQVCQHAHAHPCREGRREGGREGRREGGREGDTRTAHMCARL